MNINIDASDKRLYNKVYLPYLNDYSKDLLIFFGGASSGKSKFVSQRNILNLLKGNRNYLVCRKVGNAIRNTVYSEYKKAVHDFGLTDYFKFNDTEMFIKCVNGFKMIFKGLDDPEKIKSLIFEKGVLTDIHIEEATDITEQDYKQLTLRLRGKYKGIQKQIVMTFNPIYQTHWIKKMFFDNLNDKVEILKTTYKDNAFLTEQDRQRIEEYKDTDPYYYQVYALGDWGILGNLVYNNWIVKDLSEMQDKFSNYYYGLDFGFSQSPCAIIKLALKDNKIYVLDEFYRAGLTNADIAKVFLRQFGKNLVHCDCAEPKSIRELKVCGVNALAVSKGKDSVKHGIQWIRQKKIIIDKSCVNFINEIQTYKYKEDKDGNVLEQPVPINDHLLDATRYSLEHMMRAYKSSGLSADDFGL